jgi:hypothetical protein
VELSYYGRTRNTCDPIFIVAVLLGWALLHETLHGSEWLRMRIVLVSVAVAIASRPPAAKSTAEQYNALKLLAIKP